ncbi:unnamed protein product [marine sediment metagenome]|uniref:Uncharacterized protein n=1 Tax=marine sediment metagenome TaxID=412755 RepID=X1FAR6_9ZZZZ
MINRFQGDPAIKIEMDGATMKFIDGQPVLDQGLENAALISLFTKPGWWGNTLEQDENKKIGSNFERQRTIVDVQTINDVNDDADAALKSMKDSGLVSKFDITVTNPYTDQIYVGIIFYPPGQDAQELLLLKNGMNWINQAKNPAHERF